MREELKPKNELKQAGLYPPGRPTRKGYYTMWRKLKSCSATTDKALPLIVANKPQPMAAHIGGSIHHPLGQGIG